MKLSIAIFVAAFGFSGFIYMFMLWVTCIDSWVVDSSVCFSTFHPLIAETIGFLVLAILGVEAIIWISSKD